MQTPATRALFLIAAAIFVCAMAMLFGMAVDYETIGHGLHPTIAGLGVLVLACLASACLQLAIENK